jgi:KUP system potassium uptake protein
MLEKESKLKGIVKSLGLVFGDIGTSPIYTLAVIFLLTPRTTENVIGVLSLIAWTLVLLVTVKYAWLAMKLGKLGEGGIIVLKELLVPFLRTGRSVAFVTFLAFIGVALFVGDGVITPAISILSAVEGLLLIPGLTETPQWTLILIAGIIAVILFSVQKKGTDKVSVAFGPIMVIWFAALTLSGVASLVHTPFVLKALNPWYGIDFLLHNGFAGFFILSEVILCATGGEALYADMGHLGREPIIRAWSLVFFALLLNYFGQGAFLIQHPDAKNVLFEMVNTQAAVLYIPFLILSICATVIASQAMISGMFSIVYQGIVTRVMPIFRVRYTSMERQSQIYIGFVNWFLLAAVLFIMVEFRDSHRLAVAYGLAVTGTMFITGVFMTWIFSRKGNHLHTVISFIVTALSLVYLISNGYKIPHGGYWSLIISALPLTVILLYTQGQKALYKALRPLPLDVFLLSYNEVYRSVNRIQGTALFFAKDVLVMPPYIVHTMFKNNIVYEDNVVVSVVKRTDPFGVAGFFKEPLAVGLRTFEIQAGYMELIDVEKILREAGIQEKTIFYGVEDIMASNILWQAFSVIKKLTPNIVQFYELPANKLHGVVTRVEM